MKNLTLFILFVSIISSCNKQDEWLDKKSNKSDLIPSTIQDFQALLDNTDVMNSKYPAIGNIGSDNSYVLDQVALSTGTIPERNAYKWTNDIYENYPLASDWTNPYKTIEYSNVVLEGLEKYNLRTNAISDEIRGRALFFRAFAYYQLAQIYAKPYTENTASTELGLPLKLSADVNNLPDRATLQETYNLILQGLLEAELLLPTTTDFKTQPSKIAAQAMLSKVYFNMQNYEMASKYSSIVLSSNSQLIDFNSLNTTVNFPFPTIRGDNPEIIFYAETTGYSFNSRQNLLVVDDLFNSYVQNDLRKKVFYKPNANGTIYFSGWYTGGGNLFNGLATNEIYLIHAESLAREGDYLRAINALNKLLKERWKKEMGTSLYINQTATNQDQALSKILQERRKELPFTGNLRWEDLRRLNMDTRYAKTLTRIISGQQFILEPNSSKYVFPIPPIEMNTHPLTQNIR